MSRMSAEGAPDSFCTAMVDVADAAYACKLWFEGNGLRPTAAAVVAMTRLVLERETGPGGAPGRGSIGRRTIGRSPNADRGHILMNGHRERS
jgi:hypothetical protein